MAWTPPDPDERFVTLKDFADYLKVAAWADDASNGPALDEALNSAISWCEGAVGPLGVDEVTYRVEPRGSSLLLPAFDLQEVVSVVSPSGVEVTPTSVRLAAAIVTLSSVEAGAYAVTVRPRVLPADSMRLAIKLVGSQLFHAAARRREAGWGDHSGRGHVGQDGFRDSEPCGGDRRTVSVADDLTWTSSL